jgi:uncharacterized protein (DUF342 family)
MTDSVTETNIKDVSSSEVLAGECVLTSPWGRVRLQVDSESMAVTLVKVEGDRALCCLLTVEQLISFLQENRIVFGIIPESLKELVGCLNQEPVWEGSLVVAEGCPPTVPGRVEYTMFADAEDVQVVSSDTMIVDHETLSFSTIKKYLEQQNDPADIPDLVAKMARGGEVLVSRTAPLQGDSGRDVFGRTLDAPVFSEIVVGENVELTGDDLKFSASFFGYPVLLERKLSVLSPIVVADDKMTAWYVQLVQMAPKKNPFGMDLTILLENAGLKRETEGVLVDDVCLQLKHRGEPGWCVVAEGKEPVQGKDGELLFEGTDPPSALRDDGSIDFKVINLVKTVEADSHFATLSIPTAGRAGYTLLNEELPAESGQPLKVDAKDNVRVEECENGEVYYYSETEGVIQYQNGQLSIDPLYQVKGNVDFSTGNIDVDCCLTVAGNVCSDFTVKSTRDIVIDGILEPGSKIIVEGDLQVKGGIIGENTEVLVLGNLQAEYVQDAKIVVKGQILINQYAFSAVIRSVGSIQVGPGTGERGGSIVGGIICSSARIEAETTGSPSNVLTTLIVEPAPHKLAKLKQLKKQIAECETNILRMMRTLNLEAVESDAVKRLLQDADPRQRELYVKILNQLNLLVKQQQIKLADKKKLREVLWRDVDQMSVQVNRAFYGNTKVRIARKEMLNRQDKGRTTVIHDRTRLVVDSAKGTDDEFPE